jgi:hypothetical protein
MAAFIASKAKARVETSDPFNILTPHSKGQQKQKGRFRCLGLMLVTCVHLQWQYLASFSVVMKGHASDGERNVSVTSLAINN